MKNKNDRIRKEFELKLGSFQTYQIFMQNLNSFCDSNNILVENVSIESDYEHSYYDSIESSVILRGFSFETDEEYALRMEQEAAKKKRDAENAKKSRVKAKQTQTLKDKQEYARLKKQFEGVEVDPNSI